MPRFRKQIRQNQLRANIWVTRKHIKNVLEDAKGAGIDEKYHYDSIIDTGAMHTVISSRVVKNLSLEPSGKTEIVSASQRTTVNTYTVHISLPITERAFGRVGNNEIEVTESFHVKCHKLQVTEMPHLNRDFDLLIGMDILTNCLLILNGDDYTLSF